MIANLNWKKKLFSETYTLYSNDRPIGKLKNSSFSQTSKGEIHGKRYHFKTEGFFKPQTKIIDCSDQRVIGNITYDSWFTKATITIKGKKTLFKYTNLWHSQGSLKNREGVDISFTASSTSGKIESNADEDLLILTGLFLHQYYQMVFVILLAVFLPIFISSSK